MQVREFQKVRTLLFDGESALRSPAVQKEILSKLKIKIHAEPYWKRSECQDVLYLLYRANLLNRPSFREAYVLYMNCSFCIPQ